MLCVVRSLVSSLGIRQSFGIRHSDLRTTICLVQKAGLRTGESGRGGAVHGEPRFLFFACIGAMNPARVRCAGFPACGFTGHSYVFSLSRIQVPQGRSKIAQRFIAGLWREHKTSPVRDERTLRCSLVISVAPPAFVARQSAASARRRPGLWPFSTLNPRLKPWAIFGRPYRDFGSRALQSFDMRPTSAFSRVESAEPGSGTGVSPVCQLRDSHGRDARATAARSGKQPRRNCIATPVNSETL